MSYARYLVTEYQKTILPEYRDHYSTISACFGKEFENAFEDAKKAIIDGTTETLVAGFTKCADDYASPWFDEDTNQIRDGCEFEAGIYRKLSNILSKIEINDSVTETAVDQQSFIMR